MLSLNLSKKTTTPKMKKIVTLGFGIFMLYGMYAQTVTPFERVYTILNQKCQNQNCHSATSSNALRFDGDINAVHAAIYNVTPANSSAQSKFEKLVKPGHPYMSYLLRKIAGASFDTDLALSPTEGSQMVDVNGDTLSKKEIEFIRQWIMFSAKKTYGNNEQKPNWQLVSDYYDNPVVGFLPKPSKPNPSQGIQYRMGPVFLPLTGSTEQEWLLQQEVNFPVLPEVYKIDGFMNQQSHHFLLFKFADSTKAHARQMGMQIVSLQGGTSSFDGDKNLTAAWQDDAEFVLPQGTALFWEKKAYLDMNYHIKNYNPTHVLPCDFYFNIYYRPRSVSTIEMKANLVNRALLLVPTGVSTQDYDDPANNQGTKEWRYLWNITSHAHKYGTDYDIFIRDSTGQIAEKIYEGFWDYENNFDRGFYDWEHPSIRTWPELLPVKFGRHGTNRTGLVARTTWNNTGSAPVTFGFTTDDEMQLFYYMYTSQPLPNATAINGPEKDIYFNVYPNPMNGSGKLAYHLDKPATVSASIVDITGKEVAVLTSEKQEEGPYVISIGNNGDKLNTGIYFAKLEIDGAVYTRKFIVTE